MAATFERPSVTAELARAMIEAAEQKAAQMGHAFVIAVVDDSGVLKAFSRMDGAPLLSVQIAQDKAYTAVGFGLATDGWHDFVKDDPPLAMGAAPGIDRLIVFGGGYPITVGAYEAAGVAGIHLEDQVAPKKCGHMEGKLVIPAEEMVQKVRAAVEARVQPDFVIIARTDARAVEGLERALQRGRMYRDAGADVLFIAALTSEAEAEAAVTAFPDVPLLFNWAEGGKTPPISLDRLRELGYRIVIFPISTLLAATGAMRWILQEIAQAGTPAAAMREMPTFAEFVEFIGLPQVHEAEQRYAAKAPGPGTGGTDGGDV